MKTSLHQCALRSFLVPLALLMLPTLPALGQATFYNMATADYSQNFAEISTWANNYASGTGANNWRVATSVPTSAGSNFTVFSTGFSGGVQKGTESMIFLATGTNAGATDLLLNFSGRAAGTLSFTWAKAVNTANNANPRTSDLKVQYSLDNGATFTDVPGFSIPRISNNDTPESGAINVQLPPSIGEQSQVILRFYFWNNGQTSGSGNRPKWNIDGILATSTPASADAPAITSPSTASAIALESSSNIYQITASNSPTSFGAAGLPEGLTVDSATGIISGTAPAAGTYSISISATNSQGTGGATLTLTVLPNPGAPTITSPLQLIAPIGVPFVYQIQASNTPTSYAATGLPTGWVVDPATGLITGTPASNGSRNITISASNALGTDTKVLNVFTGSAPALTNPFGAAYVNAASSLQIAASGPATSYSAASLPAGWTLDPATGVLTGTPTATGVAQFQVTVTNPLGSASGTFTITVLDQAAQNAIPLNVVVNKYVNSVPDRIQLLVVGDGTPGSTVDLRGMIIKDFSSSNANDGGGKFIFADNEVWSAVPAGTLIDLLGPGALDPVEPFVDPANYYIAARLQDTSAFLFGGGAFDIGTNDMIMIKAAGTGVSGVAGGIHALAGGTAGAQFTGFLGAKARTAATASVGVIVNNSSSQLSDFGTSGAAASSDVTGAVPADDPEGTPNPVLDFATGNTATNQNYINALRDPFAATLSTSGTLAPFSADFGVPSASQSFTVSGANLTGNATITAPAGFEVSSDDSTFGPIATLTPVGGTLTAVPVYVRIAASAPAGVISGNVAVASTGAATLSVPASGSVNALPTFITLTTTAPNSYTQNFNSLGTTTISNVVAPTVGAQTSLGSVVTNALDGWYAGKIGGTNIATTSIVANNGSSGSGAVYNYGSTNEPANTDRSLGSLASAGLIPGFGALIKNETGQTLESVQISFTAKFWRSSTGTNNDVLTFGYGLVGASGVTTGNFLSASDATALPAANVVGPAPVVEPNGPLDGNAPANQVVFSNVAVPVSLAPGETMFIRWQDTNELGNDAGLAIDNVSFTAVAGGASPVVQVTGAAFNAFSTTAGTPSSPQTVSVSGSNLTGDLTVTAPAGFAVSSDGVTYASSVALTPAGGSVAATTISVRLTGAAAGSFSGNVSFASTGATTQNRAVTGSVTSAYDTWADGFGLDPATNGAPTADPDGDSFSNAQEYAFGTNPTQGNGALLGSTTSGGNLVVTWLQRSDVTYNVQSTGNLATSFANDGTVSVADGPVSPTPPAGYTRKQFSVPASGSKFYRVTAATP